MGVSIYVSPEDNAILEKYCFIQEKKRATLISDIIKAFLENKEKNGTLSEIILSQIEFSITNEYLKITINLPKHYLQSAQDIAGKLSIDRIDVLNRIIIYRCQENKFWVESKYSQLTYASNE